MVLLVVVGLGFIFDKLEFQECNKKLKLTTVLFDPQYLSGHDSYVALEQFIPACQDMPITWSKIAVVLWINE